MTGPNWLSTFQQKLHSNQVDLCLPQPILLKADPDTSILTADNKRIFQEDQGSHIDYYYYIDPFARIAHKQPGSCLEQNLVGKHNRDQMVIDNDQIQQLVKKYSALHNYHVVLVNAIPNFTENYYLNIVEADTLISDSAYFESYQYFNSYQLQCLVFLNDQGSYFCALPCLIPYNCQSYLKGLIVENATIKQVTDLLKPMPLIRLENYGQYYPLQVICSNRVRDYYPDQLTVCYNNSIDNYSLIKTLIRYYVKGKMSAYHLDDLTCHFICWSYHDCLFSYLNEALTAKIADNGDFIFHLKHETPKWTAELQKHKRMNLWNTSVCDGLLWSRDLYLLLQKMVIEQLNAQRSAKRQTVKSFTVEKSQAQVVSPVVDSTGLNRIMLALRVGPEHQYYFSDNRLSSLYGTQQVDVIESGELKDDDHE